MTPHDLGRRCTTSRFAGRSLPTVIAAVALPLPALAGGPGLGNLSYAPTELFKPISVIHSPWGHGNAAMVNGYLMAIYSSDSGGSPNNGGIDFWDVSNPRHLKVQAT